LLSPAQTQKSSSKPNAALLDFVACKRIFERHCSLCHGIDGKGDVAPICTAFNSFAPPMTPHSGPSSLTEFRLKYPKAGFSPKKKSTKLLPMSAHSAKYPPSRCQAIPLAERKSAHRSFLLPGSLRLRSRGFRKPLLQRG
jgi:hypothetical protein